ncbi:hypothetical protein EV175_004574 [Coemansia sp. RSA 1933]|nr:hypothetical protein EV175_004574 [Coemansia sp. RSA 1933]
MKIEKILAFLETGLGATKLSPKVQQVTLTLSQRTRASGARHFWREHLRRLQYANPELPIQVDFPREPCAPKLEIKFADSPADTLSIAGMRSDDICKQFLKRVTNK